MRSASARIAALLMGAALAVLGGALAVARLGRPGIPAEANLRAGVPPLPDFQLFCRPTLASMAANYFNRNGIFCTEPFYSRVLTVVLGLSLVAVGVALVCGVVRRKLPSTFIAHALLLPVGFTLALITVVGGHAGVVLVVAILAVVLTAGVVVGLRRAENPVHPWRIRVLAGLLLGFTLPVVVDAVVTLPLL